MHEQPAPGKSERDARVIELVFLDHQVLDVGKLRLALLVDIARQVIDSVGQPLERTLRANEMGGEIPWSLEKVLQVGGAEVLDPGVIGQPR